MVYSFFISVRNWALTGVIHYFYFFCREAASFNQRMNLTGQNDAPGKLPARSAKGFIGQKRS